MTLDPESRRALQRRIAEIQGWYHAIDLGDGMVTPGPFRMADYVEEYGLPEDLRGARALDVGCGNGFFSLELEARGADEVVAVDVPSWLAKDWSPAYAREWLATRTAAERDAIDQGSLRAAFELAVGTAGSGRIRREEASIYDLDPEKHGRFDFVLCASMLMHVRDPLLALHRLRAVCRDDGVLVISISSPPDLQGEEQTPLARFVGRADQCNFWQMSPACLRAMLECSGFAPLGTGRRFVLGDQPVESVQAALRDAPPEVDPTSVPGSGAFRDPHYVCHARPQH